MGESWRGWAWLLAAAILAAGCEQPAPDGPDGDADADADGDADADQDDADTDAPEHDADMGDGGGLEGAGPLTLVAETFSLVLDRLCDLDGDGDLDNAFADLGSPSGDMLVMAYNSAMSSARGENDRGMFHFPRVDDRAGPNTTDSVLIFYSGLDADDPIDPSDDFSGEEPFLVQAESLDPCGEPITHFEGTTLADGEVHTSGASGLIDVKGFAPLVAPEMHGTLLPRGRGGSITACTYATITALGEEEGGSDPTELTVLEGLLAGGAPLGFPTIPGLNPDVDLDGDGLESFVLDEEGRIESCVDADFTVIDGRECWRDPRMADGISVMLAFELVGARHAGLAPGWEEEIEGTCDDPPAQSLWDES